MVGCMGGGGGGGEIEVKWCDMGRGRPGWKGK